MKKTVLITGASRGLGRSTAKIFAKNNYNIIINYNISKEDALSLKEELDKQYQLDCLIVKCDIKNEEEVKNMFNIVKDKYVKIDCLVNNASICKDNFIEKKSSLEFMDVINTNLLGTFLVTKYFGTIINKGGCIINISSNNGIDMTSPLSIDYDASKAGIINMTKNMAKYYMPNIRVNCVAPGYIDTSMDEYQDTSNILLKRVGKKEEIANVIYFLASDNASYINGEVIRVDGGIMR